jgi:O-antigen ligase
MIYLLICFYILFAYLAWKNFKLALYFVFLLLPTYRVQFIVFNLPFNLLSGIIWLLVLVFFIKNYRKIPNLFKDLEKKIKSRNHIFNSFRWPLILILISAYIAVYAAGNSLSALGLFKAYFLESFFFLILLVFNLDKKDIKNCIYSLEILVGLIFITALFQKLSGNFIFNTTNVLEQGRVTTLFGYPNANGLILLPIFFLIFINLLSDKKIYLRIFHFFTLSFSLLVIYWAKSESALIAIIVGLLLFVLFKIVKNKKFILIISLGVLTISLILPWVIKAPQEIDEPGTKIYSLKEKILLQDLSGQVRRQMWAETINYLKDYPFLGAGLGAYQEKIEPYHQADYIEIFLYPHHIWFNFWISLGIWGLIGFIWLSVLLIIKLNQNLSRENLILLVAFLAIIIQGIVEVPYFKNDLAIVFLFFLAIYLIFQKQSVRLKLR